MNYLSILIPLLVHICGFSIHLECKVNAVINAL